MSRTPDPTLWNADRAAEAAQLLQAADRAERRLDAAAMEAIGWRTQHFRNRRGWCCMRPGERHWASLWDVTRDVQYALLLLDETFPEARWVLCVDGATEPWEPRRYLARLSVNAPFAMGSEALGRTPAMALTGAVMNLVVHALRNRRRAA